MQLKYTIHTFYIFLSILMIFSCQNGSSSNETDLGEDKGEGFIYPDESSQNEEKGERVYDPLVSFRDLPSYIQPALDSSKYEWEDGYAIINWDHLSKVVYENRPLSDTMVLMFPIYHDNIKALDGKKVQISGYLIPLPGMDDSMAGKIHFFSAKPMSQCFFCGEAGPESVMDVMTIKEHHNFKMDQIATFRGILHPNDTELDYMNYILKDAELIKISK